MLKVEAENLENARFLVHADVVIMTESSDDERFWRAVFNYVLPQKRITFNYAVQPSSKMAYGKTMCLKYASFTNSHFVLAVDSDFDRILGKPCLSLPYVFQTMTYSWENHYCWASTLDSIYKGVSTGGTPFNFNTFLTKFGSIIYPYITKLLAAKKNGIKCWSLDKMCSVILSIQPNRKELLSDDGKLLLKSISESLQKWESELVSPSSTAQDDVIELLNNIGVTYRNAYLYMQGHCVYDMLQRIGAALTLMPASDFEYQVLFKNLKFGHYPEINNLANDIITQIK